LLNEHFLKDKFISYEEFLLTYLETNNVDKIEIVNTMLTGKQDAQSKKIVKAVVYPKDGGKVRKLLLGNVDHFLENLEKV
jgi:AFG3 family protein